MRVIERFGRICPTRPAACHVVPHVSRPCSSSTMSRRPSLARWYAALAPSIPPPTMTISVLEKISKPPRSLRSLPPCQGRNEPPSYLQRDHARRDRGGADDAARDVAFLEEPGADQGGEDDRGLAQRRHRRHRR